MKQDEVLANNLYSKQLDISEKLINNTTNIELKKIIETLKNINLRDKKILDLGSGTGQLTNLLLNNFDDEFEVYAIDISTKDTEILKNTISAKRLKTVKSGSFYQIPFEEGYFDIIVSNHVLHYAENLDAVVREAQRVLKDNGIFIFSTVCFERQEDTKGEIIHGKLELSDKTFLNVHAFARSILELTTSISNLFLPVYDLAYTNIYLFKPHNYTPNTSYRWNTLVSIWQKCIVVQNEDINFTRAFISVSEYLKRLGFTVNLINDEIVDEDKGTHAKGYFLKKDIFIKNGLSDELKLYVLLHCFGHIAQWHYNRDYFVPLSDKLNTIDIKYINKDEHYEHEVDTMHYCVWILCRLGEYNLLPWLIQYFNSDMLYMNAYFSKCLLPDEKVFFDFFNTKPVGSDTRPLYTKEPNFKIKISYSNTPVYVI